ncbi:MAG TPA: hypothetical protein VMZ49_08965 [Patescibacteria group bacterium]|nr:hypothetical protein [Patescibacteria group bacterium]
MEKSLLLRKSFILLGNRAFVKRQREKISAVETRCGGMNKAMERGLISGREVSNSPIPSPRAVPPRRKNGTSAPKPAAISFNSAKGMFKLKYWLRKSSMTAALPLPPPRPDPGGIFLLTVMSKPLRNG